MALYLSEADIAPIVTMDETPNPSLTLVLHHLGIDRGADGIDSQTVRDVLALARHRNIAIKVSGFYYGAKTMAEYPYPEQGAVFERLCDTYTADRLVWGSDWPVSPWAACTYQQTLDLVRVHAPYLEETERVHRTRLSWTPN